MTDCRQPNGHITFLFSILERPINKFAVHEYAIDSAINTL